MFHVLENEHACYMSNCLTQQTAYDIDRKIKKLLRNQKVSFIFVTERFRMAVQLLCEEMFSRL
ncbi:hypothetical protein SAMN05192574_103289 [Mucilaginibacter gossypiicola]|uniref:Uncharacterized protein n=1 Tax=Mucilaginibacter gossypiicola TaxID=551995 RepID=A0A1H8GUU5_9SPHI|nr:hypothetical protein SAMN05192574_103289 [Mucilaginibacter gossypiicola]